MTFNLNNLNDIHNDKQLNFHDSFIGKCVSYTLDLGIRYVFPDFIENQIISFKDNILKFGLQNALETFKDQICSYNKTFKSLLSGKLNSVDEYRSLLEEGGMIDSFHSGLKEAIEIMYRKNLINHNQYINTKKVENLFIDTFKNILKKNNNNLKNIETKTKSLIDDFNNAISNKDATQLDDIASQLITCYKNMFPTTVLVKNIEKALNTYDLIKSKNYNFEFSENEINLIETL